MPRFPKDTLPTTLLSFHRLAADRGDGLDPRLLDALAKSGRSSGIPAAKDRKSDNIIEVEFGKRKTSAKKAKGS